jgi:ketosteroid isomerase-like protein
MSAAQNKQLMQEIFAGVATGDGTMFARRLAEDVAIIVTGQYSWSQTFNGKAAVLRDLYGYVRSLMKEPGKTIPERFIADGDLVVVEARGDMTTKAGERYDNHYCLIFRLENGMIKEMREYQDSTLCERVLGPYPAAARG